MSKYSLQNYVDPALYSRYKAKHPEVAVQARTEVNDENQMEGRLELIRRKYSSKEKNIFTLRGENHSKEKSRQPFKEQAYAHTKSNMNFGEHHNAHRKQISTGYLEQIKQRHEKSKEKVCERVQNIKKINDKIKSILNKFDLEAPERTSIIKRNTTNQHRDMDSSLKTKKMHYVEQHLKPREPKQQFQPEVPVFEYRLSFKKFDPETLNVSQNQSLNLTIDQSFVIQKYNPTHSKPKSNQVHDLVSKLCAQIQHDEQLRVSKYFFFLNLKEDKYEKLQKELQNKGMKYSIDQLTEQMRFVEEEYDPFMQEAAHEDYGRYANSLIAASQHWKQSIYRKFSYKRLMSDGIQEALKADSIEQGLTLSDLVRFVNLTSGNLYKNRHLILIMRRMGEGNLSFEQVFKAICGDRQ